MEHGQRTLSPMLPLPTDREKHEKYLYISIVLINISDDMIKLESYPELGLCK